MPFLEIESLQKSFGAQTVVHHFEMTIDQGEFITFLGPSGCGKTTILRMIAGFEIPSAGIIRIDGKDVTRFRPNQRNVGMVFQSYALFPNLTVAGNIGFALKVAKRSTAEIKSRVEEMLHLIKLPHLADRYPRQLSGGQQQRVALARALAGRPKVLLLDEPLSALDAKIRVSLRSEIRALQRQLGITSIFVTHDQEEALSISDRIVVLSEGRTAQIGTPFEIYNFPNNRFVASFIGTLSLLPALVVDARNGRLSVDGQDVVTNRPLNGAAVGDAVTVALRPEAITLQPQSENRNNLDAVVEEVGFLGSVIRIRARLNDAVLSLDMFNNPNQPPPELGARVALSFSQDDLLVLDAAVAAA
ncbi:MAG: ABC transporter ATP-binding protein [Azospirillaceae bacterium]|nr:ABC transporter ATP-binding protein [Azospirillaceae bacterium]